MKPESGRVYASLSPSLSRASSIDRSIASRCLRSRRARRALPSSLVRDNPIPSRAIHSSRGRAAPSSPASIASTAPRARRSTYIHKHQLIDQTKKNNHGTHAQQNKNKEPDRWHHPRARLRVPSPRARRLDPSIGRARIVLARAGDVDSSSRLARESRVRRVRSVVAFDGRGRWRTRANGCTARANGCTARANGARDANARETEVEVRRDEDGGTGRRTRSRNARETRSSIVRGRFAEGVDSIE